MRILIASCVLMGIYAVGEGCSCWPYDDVPLTPKSFGCRSTFIIVAEVMSDLRALVPEDMMYMYYRIRVSDVIKFTGSMDGIDFDRVFTAENTGLCGIRLDRGLHVLSGFIDGNRLMMNLCFTWFDPFPLSEYAARLLSRFARNRVNCLPRDLPPS